MYSFIQLFKEHYDEKLFSESATDMVVVNTGAIAQIQSHRTGTPYILQLEHTTPSA